MNVRGTGVGWSWGISAFRIGVSGTGQRWFSIGVPGTGLRFYKTLGGGPSSTEQLTPREDVPGQIGGPTVRTIGTTPPNTARRMSWRNIRNRSGRSNNDAP